MRFLVVIYAVFFCSLATANEQPALASESNIDYTGFYIGGGIGSTIEDWTLENGSTMSYDGAASIIYGGFHITHWFGLEALINYNFKEYGAISINVSPKFTIQLSDNTSLFFKIGLNMSSAGDSSRYRDNDDDDDHDWFDRDIASKNTASSADYAAISGKGGSGISLAYGLGANFHITKSLFLRAGIEKTDVETTFNNDNSYSSYGDIDIEHEIFTTYAGAYYQF